MTTSRQIIQQLTAHHPTLQVIDKFVSAADLQLAASWQQSLSFDGFPTQDSSSYIYRHAIITAKLYRIFDSLTPSLPLHRPTMRVLSIGYHTPNDFLALKGVLNARRSTCKMIYTGVDIDAETNTDVISLFKKFADFHIITANASEPVILKNALQEKNILPPSGYDLIILRQPNFACPTQRIAFTKIVREVIPFLSHQQTVVVTSFLGLRDLGIARPHFQLPSYSQPATANSLDVRGCYAFDSEDGHEFEFDCHSRVYHCRGFALGLHADAAHAELLATISKIPATSVANDALLKAITARNYNVALRTAASQLRLEHLQVLLTMKYHLSLEINQPSTSYYKTALDWALTSKEKDLTAQAAVYALLIKHGAKTAKEISPEKAVINSPRP